MAGKGSKPRPLSVDSKTFEERWDKIFKKSDPDMWDHRCKHNGEMSIARGEECSWCGEVECLVTGRC
jgi:hypothetical protein